MSGFVGKMARKAPVLGGGGIVSYRAARASVTAKPLVAGLCACSRLGAALRNVAGPSLGVPRNPTVGGDEDLWARSPVPVHWRLLWRTRPHALRDLSAEHVKRRALVQFRSLGYNAEFRNLAA